MTKERACDPQDRLIDYAVRIITLSDELVAILFTSIEAANTRKER
jgi:hypothetical protein